MVSRPGPAPRLKEPVRVQIILEQHQHEALDAIARQRKCSRSEVVRDLIDSYSDRTSP